MQEMDCVEVIAEKEKYAMDGVHKGMHGWICDPRTIDGTWLVNFPQCGEHRDIATSEPSFPAAPPFVSALRRYIVYHTCFFSPLQVVRIFSFYPQGDFREILP